MVSPRSVLVASSLEGLPITDICKDKSALYKNFGLVTPGRLKSFLVLVVGKVLKKLRTCLTLLRELPQTLTAYVLD